METPMSYEEMLGVVEEVMEKPVQVQQRPYEEAISGMLKMLAGSMCERDGR